MSNNKNFIGGMQQTRLSKGLLSLIIMVQKVAKGNSAIAIFNKDHNLSDFDWYAETERFFCNIDDNILEKYYLSKNNLSFEKVLFYKITDNIMQAEETQLQYYIF